MYYKNNGFIERLKLPCDVDEKITNDVYTHSFWPDVV